VLFQRYDCSLVAHSARVNSNNFIFKHTELQGLTCFQIAHHPLTAGLWISNPETKPEKRPADGNEVSNEGAPMKKHMYSVSTKHGMYIYLRRKYGLSEKKGKGQIIFIINNLFSNHFAILKSFQSETKNNHLFS
jgi:hypothetical protein